MSNSTNILPLSLPKRPSNYPWVLVGLLWGVALLNYLDRQMLSTMRPAMSLSIKALENTENFGRLMAVFLWIYGLMSPLSGMIADKLNKKWLIIASLFVWSTITLLMGYAHTFNDIYILRAFMGISEALYIPAALSLIIEFHSIKSRSLAIGIHMSGLYIGQALGGFGATMAGSLSWQVTFHWFGIIGVIYSLILILFLPSDRGLRDNKKIEFKTKSNVFAGSRRFWNNSAFWIILFYFAISSLPGWAIKNWLPTLISQNLHVEMAIAGPVATISIAIASLAGVLFGGILSDWWLQENLKARIYTSCIGLGLTIPALLLLGFGHSFISAIAAGVTFGIGYGMFDANNMPILCQFIPQKNRASAYGIMNMIGVFAGAIVTNILGKAAAFSHLGNSFAWMSLAVCMAIFILLIFLKPKTNDCLK